MVAAELEPLRAVKREGIAAEKGWGNRGVETTVLLDAHSVHHSEGLEAGEEKIDDGGWNGDDQMPPRFDTICAGVGEAS